MVLVLFLVDIAFFGDSIPRYVINTAYKRKPCKTQLAAGLEVVTGSLTPKNDKKSTGRSR